MTHFFRRCSGHKKAFRPSGRKASSALPPEFPKKEKRNLRTLDIDNGYDPAIAAQRRRSKRLPKNLPANGSLSERLHVFTPSHQRFLSEIEFGCSIIREQTRLCQTFMTSFCMTLLFAPSRMAAFLNSMNTDGCYSCLSA